MEQAPTYDTSITLSEAQSKNANLQTGKAALRPISSVLKVNGRIDAPKTLVHKRANRRISQTDEIDAGHAREKGEVIAVMEDQQYIQLQQDYLSAKARLNFMAHEYLRQQELNQSKASSDKAFQQTEADYLTAKINVGHWRRGCNLLGSGPAWDESNLSKSINVYSPIDGHVSKVNVNIGKYTQPSDELFE